MSLLLLFQRPESLLKSSQNICSYSSQFFDMIVGAVVFVACVASYVDGNDWREDNKVLYLEKKQLEKTVAQQHGGTRDHPALLHPAFHCPDMGPSPSIPTSVEYVKAADIKVIAALGDSLTTAIAANGSTILSIPIEHRHLSWSIGGHGTYSDIITLANIVKLFNPEVLGPAPVSTISGYPTTINQTGFNFAVTGHNSLNVSEQTRHMIDTFRSYPGLNFEEDWKLATILIGMNDICDYCKNETLFSPDNFILYMTESLEMMMAEVPRLIVNVVQILPMHPLREVKRPTLGCQLQKTFCSCLVLPEENSPELKELIEVNREFQRKLKTLLHSDRFFRKDFAVVLQPYLENALPPRLPNGSIDLSFFSADCFHFTIKGHEELAKGLWNNMFQPEGKKEQIMSFTDPVELICPPEDHPYIYTRPTSAAVTPCLCSIMILTVLFLTEISVH